MFQKLRGLRLERSVKDDRLMASQEILLKYFDSWNGEPALFQRADIRYQNVINGGRRIERYVRSVERSNVWRRRRRRRSNSIVIYEVDVDLR